MNLWPFPTICLKSNDVYVIDAHRDSVVATIDVGDGPFVLAWDPIGYRTYVLNYASASVSVIRDSLHAGVAEGQPQAVSLKPQATLLRGVLVLGAVGSRQNAGDRSELLDVSGRKVLDLHPGTNDVSRLSPGVYFVVTPSPSSSPPEGERVGVRRHPASVTKVVITR